MNKEIILEQILIILNSGFTLDVVNQKSLLLSDGLLDSLNLMLFVEKIEDQYQIVFHSGEINNITFETPVKIADLIAIKIQLND